MEGVYWLRARALCTVLAESSGCLFQILLNLFSLIKKKKVTEAARLTY